MIAFDERYRCTALAKRTGERCRRSAHPGATVCKMHGAAAPQVQASARARLEQKRMAEKLGRLMVELEGEAHKEHPIDVLHDAVARSEALVRVIAAQVAKLDGETGGDWTNPTALYGPDHKGDGAPHVLVKMYTEALDRAGKLSKAAIDAGLDERRVVLQEGQFTLLWATIRASVLESMFRFERMLPPDRRVEFRAFVSQTGSHDEPAGLGEVVVRHLDRLERAPSLAAEEAHRSGLSLLEAPQALAMSPEARVAYDDEAPQPAVGSTSRRDEW